MMRVRPDLSNIENGFAMFEADLLLEHLAASPQSLIPLTDLIAETHEGNGDRIAYWLRNAPAREEVYGERWGAWRGGYFREM